MNIPTWTVPERINPRVGDRVFLFPSLHHCAPDWYDFNDKAEHPTEATVTEVKRKYFEVLIEGQWKQHYEFSVERWSGKENRFDAYASLEERKAEFDYVKAISLDRGNKRREEYAAERKQNYLRCLRGALADLETATTYSRECSPEVAGICERLQAIIEQPIEARAAALIAELTQSATVLEQRQHEEP